MKQRLRKTLLRAGGWVESRSRRERALGLLATMALLGGLFWSLVMAPALDQVRAAEVRTLEAREAQARVADQVSRLAARLEQDPDEAVRTEIREVHARIDELSADLRHLTADLVPPDRMKQVLRRLLSGGTGTRLIALRTRATETVLAPNEQGPGIFRHGVELVFEADYGATTAWLERVETLPWRFGWQRLEYEVTDHPRARVTLRLFTLSGHEDWLGV